MATQEIEVLAKVDQETYKKKIDASLASGIVPITLGDGNCAFNAFALGLCDLALAGKLDEHLSAYNILQKKLSLEDASLLAFQNWLRINTDTMFRQQTLQVILREIAVDFILANYEEAYKGTYKDLLLYAYNKQSEDDTFVVHEHIKKKFAEKLTKEELLHWWDSEGKAQYFVNIRQSARNASDRERWGGEPEIDALAVVFSINIKWKKGGNAERVVGIGGGIVKDLIPSEKKLLNKLEVGDYYGDLFRLRPFKDEYSFRKAIGSVEDAIKLPLLEYFANSKEISKKLPSVVNGLTIDEHIKQLLKNRGILNISNELIGDCDIQAIDLITAKLNGITDAALREKVLQAFRPAVVSFEMEHKLGHWEYKKVIELQGEVQREYVGSNSAIDKIKETREIQLKKLQDYNDLIRQGAAEYFRDCPEVLKDYELSLLHDLVIYDVYQTVRIAAAEALYVKGTIENREMAQEIIFGLLSYPGLGKPHQDGADLVRENAATAMGRLKICNPKAINALTCAAQNDVFQTVRDAARDSLVMCRPKVDETCQAMLDSKQINYIFMTIKMIVDVKRIFQLLFNPPTKIPVGLEITEITTDIIQQAIFLLTQDIPQTLLANIIELVNGISLYTPSLKTTEEQTITELMLRVSRQQRPQYFLSLQTEEPVAVDTWATILNQFFQELTQTSGALDLWAQLLSRIIREQEVDDLKKEAFLEFIQVSVQFFKEISSGQDPLNKKIDPRQFAQAMRLKSWLEDHNRQHPRYIKNQHEYRKLCNYIKDCRLQALQNGVAYINSIFERIQAGPPTLLQAGIGRPQQIKTMTRIALETYVLKRENIFDIFEPEHLRAFWEDLYRNQYGMAFYEVVCESFTAEYKGNHFHRAVQQIWDISLLDTINVAPLEARSRMPARASDRSVAPNFGYQLQDSQAYRNWLENPNSLACVCGDIIIDAFYAVIDFGHELNIEEFLERFTRQLSNQHSVSDYYNPHRYDRFIIPFELYLLEQRFQQPFICGQERSIPGELLKKGDLEELRRIASVELKTFNEFSTNMLKLRPQPESSKQSKRSDGLVLGIGFNGELFASPSHAAARNNEIWLNFSASGRNQGGDLLLAFLMDIAKYSEYNLPNLTKDNFIRYKLLIRKRVAWEIKNTYYRPDIELDDYIIRQRDKFERFICQLEQEIPFEFLSFELKMWLSDVKNWYRLPADVEVLMAGSMLPVEVEVQQYSRELLFTALTTRRISREYPALIPALYFYWQTRVLASLASSDAALVRANPQARLADLPKQLQINIITKLDELVCQVHPVLRSVWDGIIAEEYQRFIRLKKELFDKKLYPAKQKLKNLLKQSKKLPENDEIKEAIEKTKLVLVEIERQIQEVPGSPAELTEEDYIQFKINFFAGRHKDVAGCVEASFARVLGHDHFFPVFISRKTVQTCDETHALTQLGNRFKQDVIAPCAAHCQLHALGHLYIGDLLSRQSADHLDTMRHTHDLGEVPDRFMTMAKFRAEAMATRIIEWGPSAILPMFQLLQRQQTGSVCIDGGTTKEGIKFRKCY